ncbi:MULTISPECIES: hypothetical protein [Microbacterium]|jgi:hypothetical protein|uniref:hypothetical protein n=1 Tax=Microbacterium TaxID=33882 RepID=UPI000A4665E5|nr:MULTISPECIES: hypothetical protein [Microbacterium]
MFGFVNFFAIILVYGLAALVLGAVIYFAVLLALKSHTRWVDQGKQGRARPF